MVGAKAWGSVGAFGTAASFVLAALLLFMNVQTGLEMKDGRPVRPAADDLAIVLVLDGVGAILAFTFLAALFAVRERHVPTFGSLLAAIVGILALGFWLLRAGFEVVALRSVNADKDLARDAYGVTRGVTDAATALALLAFGLWILMVSLGALRRRHLPVGLAWSGVVVALADLSVFFLGTEFLQYILAATAAWFAGLGVAIPVAKPPLPQAEPARPEPTASPPVVEPSPTPAKPVRRKG